MSAAGRSWLLRRASITILTMTMGVPKTASIDRMETTATQNGMGSLSQEGRRPPVAALAVYRTAAC